MITVVDHGEWENYKPAETAPIHGIPPGMGVIYHRRVSDGVDWYEHRDDESAWGNDSLKVTLIKFRGEWLVQAVHRDASYVLPAGQRVIEVLGHDPEDPKPWKAYEGKVYDFTTGEFRAPTPLPAPILPISDRQFAQGLALRGLITQAEALQWVRTGDLPAPIENFVSGLPEDQAFAARMILSGATEFRRDNPLVAAFGQLTGMDDAALDAFWRECATL